MSQDYDLQEFLPKDDRLKADQLETWGWDGHAVTICNIGRKEYPARDGNEAEAKLQVFFTEFPGWALECNVTQTKKLKELLGERTSLWIGRQVILLSIDSKTPQGQPCKTIQVKEVRAVTAPPGAPAAPTPFASSPASAAPSPAQGAAVSPPAVTAPTVAPPSDYPSPPVAGIPGDPFAEDDGITAEQMAKIHLICTRTKQNEELLAVSKFNVNLSQLSYSQAAAFIVELSKADAQTAGAMAR